MLKKIFLVALTFILSFSTLSGCFSNDEEQSLVEKLSIDGEEVLLRVGDVYYTADDLLGESLTREEGAKKAFESVFRVFINQEVPRNNKSVEFQVETTYNKWLDEVGTEAENQGADVDELIEVSLEEEGYNSIEDYKKDIAKEFQFEIAVQEYWDEYKSEYLAGHIEDRMQYYLRHVLVKTPENDNTDLFYTNISEDNAENLYNVFKMIEEDNSFSTVAEILSEDEGSALQGGAYKMDITTSFVNEFRFGTIAFDAYTRGEDFGNIEGIDEELADELDLIYGNGFNTVLASDFVNLNERKDENYLFYISNSPSNSNMTKPRNIIFNSVFNNPGVSLIEYDLDAPYPSNTCDFDFAAGELGPETKRVMCDEKGNPIFIVRGSHGIHFLVIENSPYDLEDTTNFFSLEESEEYETYIEMFQPSVSEMNERIDELEELAKLYAENGIDGCTTCPRSEEFIYFDMYEDYLVEYDGDIEVSEFLETLINEYISIRRNDGNHGYSIKINRYIESYISKLNASNSEFINKYKVPLACLDHEDEENEICEYSPENGFELIDEGEGE